MSSAESRPPASGPGPPTLPCWPLRASLAQPVADATPRLDRPRGAWTGGPGRASPALRFEAAAGPAHPSATWGGTGAAENLYPAAFPAVPAAGGSPRQKAPPSGVSDPGAFSFSCSAFGLMSLERGRGAKKASRRWERKRGGEKRLKSLLLRPTAPRDERIAPGFKA